MSLYHKIWSGLILFFVGLNLASSRLTVQPDQAFQATLTPQAYLPIVMLAPQQFKTRSGIHLGNRNADWPAEAFEYLQYRPDGEGVWPAVIVVLSNQIYEIPRFQDPTKDNYCRVKWFEAAKIKSPVAFEALRQASQAGTKVIIRIYPSPGNYKDYDQQEWPNHRQVIGEPAGPRYLCNHELEEFNEIGRFKTYRSPGDLVDEMASIHAANLQNGWTEYGFEPANEPNLEWHYPPFFEWGDPPLDNLQSWTEMDKYFSEVYKYLKRQPFLGDFKIFAPPMEQEWHSIGINLADCEAKPIVNDIGQPIGIGYDFMRETYSQAFDGYDWHNYWLQGYEKYASCEAGGNLVSFYFPPWMKTAIRDKGGHITEANLASVDQMGGINPLKSKKGVSNAQAAAASWGAFMAAEPHADYVAAWLLNDNTGNIEHDWHEAYSDTADHTWLWFRAWWSHRGWSP